MKVGIGAQNIFITHTVPSVDESIAPPHGKNKIFIPPLPFKYPRIMKFMAFKLGTYIKIGIIAINGDNGISVSLRFSGISE